MNLQARRLFLVLTLATACACAGSRPGGGSKRVVDSGAVGAPIDFSTLHVSTHSCQGPEREEWVLRDAASWDRWWSEIACRVGSPQPEHDASTRMVLAVADREGPNGCYAVRIAEVRADVGGGCVAVVERHVPSAEQVCTMAIVHPVHAVAVPIRRGPVRFEWTTVTGPPEDVGR